MMDERSQKRMSIILAKSKQDLTEADQAFLKARRAYLTPDQEDTLLGEDVVLDPETDDGLPKTMPELKSLAKSLGLSVPNTTKLPELKEMISQAQLSSAELPPTSKSTE